MKMDPVENLNQDQNILAQTDSILASRTDELDPPSPLILAYEEQKETDKLLLEEASLGKDSSKSDIEGIDDDRNHDGFLTVRQINEMELAVMNHLESSPQASEQSLSINQAQNPDILESKTPSIHEDINITDFNDDANMTIITLMKN